MTTKSRVTVNNCYQPWCVIEYREQTGKARLLNQQGEDGGDFLLHKMSFWYSAPFTLWGNLLLQVPSRVLEFSQRMETFLGVTTGQEVEADEQWQTPQREFSWPPWTGFSVGEMSRHCTNLTQNTCAYS